MALSPFRNKSSVNRCRSTSFSSPNSRSFHYQEVLTAGENALVRSISCGQFFTRGKRGETIESTQVRITNFVSPVKTLNDNGERSIKLRDIGRKKAKISIEFPAPEKTSRKIFTMANLTYLNLFIFMILCTCCFYRMQYCNTEWKTQTISSKLKQTVFGQDKVLTELALLLEKFSHSNESMVISFTGSTGVGKTLIADVIQDNFPWGMNKYLNFFHSNPDKISSGRAYSSCGANLIIIDDLDATTLEKALNLVENTSFNNTISNKKLLFILIFQSHNLNDLRFILDSLNHSKFKIHNLVFNDLNHSHVKKCFKVELKRQGKYLPDKNLNMVVNEHMRYCNISRSYLGCKNVLNEVSLIGGDL